MSSKPRFHFVPWPLAALLAFGLLFPVATLAGEGRTDFLQLRIQGDREDNVTIEMPVKVFEYLQSHSKNQVDVGKVNGREIRFPSEDLLKILKGGKAKNSEVLFFSAKDERGTEARFYVKTFSREMASGAKKPTNIVFSVREKGGKESTHLSLSLDLLDSFSGSLSSGEKKTSDFGPFLRSCLAAAKDLGPGTLVKITGGDGVVGLFLE